MPQILYFNHLFQKILVPLDPCNDIIIPIDEFDRLKGHRMYDDIRSLMQHFISGIELEIGVQGALVYDALGGLLFDWGPLMHAHSNQWMLSLKRMARIHVA